MRFCDERIQKHLLNGGKIKTKRDNFPVFLNKYGSMCYKDMYYSINKNDLTANDWEIVESEYDWDKIIKDKILCVFGKGMNQYYIVGYLQGINSDGKFELLGGLNYDQCKPFNPADFNIAKDLKEYEK